MMVRITRPVPGLTEFKALGTGDEVHLSDGLAGSLIVDGYAEPIGQSPAERRETAAGARRSTRTRKAA